MPVRSEACRLLGRFEGVDEALLLQTLDKKVMSHLRAKKTEHEMVRDRHRGGGRGKPIKAFGEMQVDKIRLTSTGACGAFVHGLEDEFCEVRTEAVRALATLCSSSTALAVKALDFLADMLNDEIDEVRLGAIRSMAVASQHAVLRDEQVEVLLGVRGAAPHRPHAGRSRLSPGAARCVARDSPLDASAARHLEDCHKGHAGHGGANTDCRAQAAHVERHHVHLARHACIGPEPPRAGRVYGQRPAQGPTQSPRR